MNHDMNHMQMNHEAGTSLWLIAGAVLLLLLSIAAYFLASRTQNKVLSHMKKNERATIKKKSRAIRLAAHSLLGVSIIILILFFTQGAFTKYDVADLNANATIDVTDDPYYGAEHTEEPIGYDMPFPLQVLIIHMTSSLVFTLTSRDTLILSTIWSMAISSFMIEKMPATS